MKNRMYIYLILLSGILMLGGCAGSKGAASKDTLAGTGGMQSVNPSVQETAETSLTPTDESLDQTIPNQSAEAVPTLNPMEASIALDEMIDFEEYDFPALPQRPLQELPLKLAPVITTSIEKQKGYLEGTDTQLFTAQTELVRVANEGYEVLNLALSERFPSISEDRMEQMYKESKEEYDIAGKNNNPYYEEYYHLEGAELARVDANVASFKGFTLDTYSGEELVLSDILADEEGFKEIAATYVVQKLYETYENRLPADYEAYVKKSFQPGGVLNWYLNGSGIVIVYTEEELAVKHEYGVEITLPYTLFGGYMKPQYCYSNGTMVARISPNTDISLCLGEESEIVLKAVLDEYEMLTVSIASDDAEQVLDSYARICEAYVMKREDGRSFLFVTCDWASDDYAAHVYEITDGNLRECEEWAGAYVTDAYLAPDKVKVRTALKPALGYHYMDILYTFTKDGNLVSDLEYYAFDYDYAITAIMPVPVVLNGSEATLETGTEIVLTGTNNEDSVDFRVLKTGEEGTIYYEDDPSDFGVLIDGVSEFDYFQGLAYAG